jgi:hypothetical protein
MSNRLALASLCALLIAALAVVMGSIAPPPHSPRVKWKTADLNQYVGLNKFARPRK